MGEITLTLSEPEVRALLDAALVGDALVSSAALFGGYAQQTGTDFKSAVKKVGAALPCKHCGRAA